MGLFDIVRNPFTQLGLGSVTSEGDTSWISTSTVIKTSVLLLASSVFLFGLASVIRPVAPIIEEILDEEPNYSYNLNSTRNPPRNLENSTCEIPIKHVKWQLPNDETLLDQ